ncbi:MAG TPA: hypothetical protein VF903_00010 [Nitrospirota bacterium]
MLKINRYSKSSKGRLYKFFYLLFVAVFAAYPVLDAHLDAVNSSLPGSLSAANDMDDDGGKDHVLFHAVHASHDDCSFGHVVFPATTAISCLTYLIANASAHVQGIKSLQGCRPLSSGLSPPVS